MKKEALLYEKLENKLVHCYLCSHQCRIADKKFGFCGVRQNIGGALYTYAYGKVVAVHIDPIEDKLEENPRYLLLLVDREKARMFIINLGKVEQSREIFDRKGLQNNCIHWTRGKRI